MSTLGERVRQLRSEKKLSQQEFAERLGISQSFLSEVERDVKIPGGDMLLSLKRSFGASVDWLLAGELKVFAEGSRIGPAGETPPPNVARDREKALEAKVAKLESEVQNLKGQVAAYKEILGTLKRPIK
jgi:transcriptional regulator with XRE-family HTH domain